MNDFDMIDALIDALNAGVEDIQFDRDILETNRPEAWGAVEMGGEEASDWADGSMVDQVVAIDIWVCAQEHGSRIRRAVQKVLRGWALSIPDAGWKFAGRQYVYELDKVLWRWTVLLPVAVADEEADG